MARSDAEIEARLLATIRRNQVRLRRSRLPGALLEASLVWLAGMLLFGALAGETASGGAWLGAAAVGAAMALGLASGSVLRGTSLFAVAERLDRTLELHDRVSSALQFLRQPRRSAFMQAHMEETADFLESRDDFRLPAERGNALRLTAVLLGCSLAAALPHADRQWVERREQLDREQVRRERGQALISDLKNLRQEAEVRNLRRLADVIAQAERVWQRRLAFQPREERPEPTPPETPADEARNRTGRPDTGQAAQPDAAGANRSQDAKDGVRVASRATYQAVGKFDAFPEEAYADVFAELDGVVLDAPLDAREMQNLAEHVDSVAGKINNFAFLNDAESCNVEGARRGPRSGSMPDNSFESALAPLQYKAFSEFLKRYAAHLADKAAGQARQEESGRVGMGRDKLDVPGPPPKDAKFTLQGFGEQRPDMPILQPSEQAARELAARLPAQPGSGPQKGTQRGGTEVGGSGAGSGASEHTLAAPAILPRAEGGEYLRLQGRLGEGESVIQLIQDRGRHNLGATRTESGVGFDDVFREYAHSAEADMNGEGVPWYMREFVRDYFRSIRPGGEEGPAKP
jgi:hypothetical protein